MPRSGFAEVTGKLSGHLSSRDDPAALQVNEGPLDSFEVKVIPAQASDAVCVEVVPSDGHLTVPPPRIPPQERDHGWHPLGGRCRRSWHSNQPPSPGVAPCLVKRLGALQYQTEPGHYTIDARRISAGDATHSLTPLHAKDAGASAKASQSPSLRDQANGH